MTAEDSGTTGPASDEPSLDRLIALWRQLLGTEDIDADSHFFLVGGDSLQFARLISRLQDRWGWRLALTHLADCSTPHRMWAQGQALAAQSALAGRATAQAGSEAAGVARIEADTAAAATTPATVAPAGVLLPATARGLWFGEALAQGAGLYRGTVVLQWHGGVQEVALREALDWLLQRHPLLAGVVEFDLASRGPRLCRGGPRPVLVSLPTGVPLAHALDALPTRQDWQRQLFAAGLLQRRRRAPLLVLEAQHLLVDGWSGAVLLQDLVTAYAGAVLRRLTAPAPAEGFARHCLASAAGPARASRGADLVQPLQMACRRGPFRLASQRRRLPVRWWRHVLRSAARHAVSPFALLLTALRLALARQWPGLGDLIQFPHANRSAAEEQSVGCFMQVLVVPVRLPVGLARPEGRVEISAAGLPPLLAEVEAALQRSLAEALAVPALAETQTARLPSGNAFSDVLLALQNFPHARLEVPDARLLVHWLPPVLGQHPLRLDVVPGHAAVELCCDYASDELSEQQIARLLQDFSAVLASWR